LLPAFGSSRSLPITSFDNEPRTRDEMGRVERIIGRQADPLGAARPLSSRSSYRPAQVCRRGRSALLPHASGLGFSSRFVGRLCRGNGKRALAVLVPGSFRSRRAKPVPSDCRTSQRQAVLFAMDQVQKMCAGRAARSRLGRTGTNAQGGRNGPGVMEPQQEEGNEQETISARYSFNWSTACCTRDHVGRSAERLDISS